MSLWTNSGIPTSGFRSRGDFEFESYDIMHESNEMSFLNDALSSTLCFGRRVLLWISFDHGYDLEREHFLRIFDGYPYLEVM